MAIKFRGWCGKFTAILFTSIVAPVLVNLATRDDANFGSTPTWNAPAFSRPLEPPRPVAPASPAVFHLPAKKTSMPPQAVEVVRVIACGSGRTPEAALQDALYTALRQTLATQFDAETWERKGPALSANVLSNRAGLILSWKDFGSRKEWRLWGTRYREQVAVEVNLSALRNRLRAGG